ACRAPATTANAVPSRMTSMAAAVASRAWISFAMGMPMDPEQSMMMISAALTGDGGPSGTEPTDETVTMALTTRALPGRYSFWKTSTVNPGALIAACSYGFAERKTEGLVGIAIARSITRRRSLPGGFTASGGLVCAHCRPVRVVYAVHRKSSGFTGWPGQ